MNDEYISYKVQKVKIEKYKCLTFGVVYADFLLKDLADEILSKNSNLDFVMIICDETAYLYTNKLNINVEDIARNHGGSDNHFDLREPRDYFAHKMLFSIEFLGYDKNTYYKEIAAKDKEEALYKFHKDNYGDVKRCEFLKYLY